MDFTFTSDQDEAAQLAARILGDRATPERMTAVEDAGDRFDRELWQDLGSAGLLSLHLPEEHGGAGLGLVELSRVLVEVGRRVAPVPLAAHGAASLLLAEHGDAEQREQWLARRGHRGAGGHRRGLGGAGPPAGPADHHRRPRRRRLGAHRLEGGRAGRLPRGPLPRHRLHRGGRGRLPRRAGRARPGSGRPAHQRPRHRGAARPRRCPRAGSSAPPTGSRRPGSPSCWSSPRPRSSSA